MGTLMKEVKKLNLRQKGAALFLTLIFSLIGLILVGGLYLAYQRMLGIVFPIKTYVTLREAVAGTVELIASYIDKDYFKDIGQGCPAPLTQSGNFCCNSEIKFRLIGEQGTFIANATICLVGIAQAGFGISPVVELDPASKVSQPYIYSIIVRAYGPRGTTSTIESVYQSR
jgi:hypothetical protein